MRMRGNEIVIGVAGAGTMGAGIAQAAAASEHPVILFDVSKSALDTSLTRIEESVNRRYERQQISNEQRRSLLSRLEMTSSLEKLSECSLVIEAIFEDLQTKRELLKRLEEVVRADCTLGTNTSSLSVTSISSVLQIRDRFLGTHFFNPAAIMPLVELVRTDATSERALANARETIEGWGKLTITLPDTPGFIVNRVARPFYLEALKMLEEGVADIATIDWAMRECKGFKMGPFELMDLIGNDVNYAVSESIFTSFYYVPRFRPSYVQRQLVQAGNLGRKTGKGFYDYGGHASKLQPTKDAKLAEEIGCRILFMIFNEAADAVFHRIASPADIDRAMVKAVNYPRGPLLWADEIGISEIVHGLEALQSDFGDDRYRPNPLLKRMMKSGETFYQP